MEGSLGQSKAAPQVHMVSHTIDLIRHTSKMADQSRLPLFDDQWEAILGGKNQDSYASRASSLLRPCRGCLEKTLEGDLRRRSHHAFNPNFGSGHSEALPVQPRARPPWGGVSYKLSKARALHAARRYPVRLDNSRGNSACRHPGS